MHEIGLDISDRSIELASVTRRKGRLSLVASGRIDLPPGAIEHGHVLQPEEVGKAIVALLDKSLGARRGKVRAGIALPSSLVYSKTFMMPPTLDRTMLRQAATIEAQDFFPIAASDALGDVIVGAPNPQDGTRSVMYFAVARDDVKSYRQALLAGGVEPIWFDAEELAIARGLGVDRPRQPVLIVDVGARATLILLVAPDGPRMSSTVIFGGDKLTETLEQKLSLSMGQAETLKRSEGLDPNSDDGRVFLILQQTLEELIAEVRATIDYARRRFGIEVKGIVLSGGTSLMPGFVEYLGSNFPDTVVAHGDPFLDVEGHAAKDGVLFSSAIGLALRAIGARASPGVNFVPEAERRRGAGGGIARMFSNLFALTMPTKRSGPKKGKTKKDQEAPVQPAPVEPAPPEIESLETPARGRAVLDMTPPELLARPETAAEAPEVKTEKKRSAPVMAPIAEAEPPKPVLEPEDKDFGSGIGEILGQTPSTRAKGAASSPAPTSEADKLSITSILRRGDDDVTPEPPRERSGGSWVTRALIVLLLIIFAVAAVGVYMFMKKNGLPVFGTGEETPPTPIVGEPEPSAPTSVSATAVVVGNEEDVGEGVILSRVVQSEVSATDTFPSTGSTQTTAGKSAGKATIINKTSNSYTFVGGTRLLSAEDVLFRTVSTAAIPANGSVTVDVIADQPGPSGDIGPTTFTIPGLSPALQKEITGVSDAPMTGGAGVAKAVSEEDLAAAKAALEAKLRTEAMADIRASLQKGEALDPGLITSQIVKIDAPEPKTIGATFTVTATFRFSALLVPEAAIMPLLGDALTAAFPGGVPEGTTLGEPTYVVIAYDTAAERAEIRAEAEVLARDAGASAPEPGEEEPVADEAAP